MRPVTNVVIKLLPLTLAVFIGFLVIGMQLPVLPLHLHDTLGMDTLVVGLVVGSQFAAPAVALVGRQLRRHARRQARRGGGLGGRRRLGPALSASLAFLDAPTTSVWILVPAASCWPWAKA